MRPYLMSLLILAGCGTASQPATLKHAFGHTRIEPRQELESCQHTADNSYLTAIFKRIADRNPQTFYGDYAPEKFCVGILSSSAVNAASDPKSRQIVVTRGLLLRVETDAEVAATLAHEAAHVTMQSRSVPMEERYPVLASDPEYKAAAARIATLQAEAERLDAAATDSDTKIAALVSDVRAHMTSAQKARDAALRRTATDPQATQAERDQAKRDLYDLTLGAIRAQGRGADWNALAADRQKIDDDLSRVKDSYSEQRAKLHAAVARLLNDGAESSWMEQEADEVGLEFYIRAGFAPERFTDIFWLFLGVKDDSSDLADCRTYFGALSRGDHPTHPARGRESHPGECWRIYDLDQVERGQTHIDDYARLLREQAARGERPITTLLPGKLEALQRAL